MSADAQPQREVPSSRRRPKPTLSCTLCRRRKLKCDRQQPCKTCIDRGLSLSCTFTRSNTAPQETRIPPDVHDRISQLEQLVTTLMATKNVEQPSPGLSYRSQPDHYSDEDKIDTPSTPDRVKLSNDTTSYTSNSHWTSILDGISELKDHLDQIPSVDHPKDSQHGEIPGLEIPGPDLLFGRQRHATHEELLNGLYPRSETDLLINAYFDAMTAAPSVLHQPSFRRKYELFWAQPYDASTMWLGFLYAIMSLGARYLFTRNDPKTEIEFLLASRWEVYRERVVQALILANYTKCPPYALETCFLYFAVELSRSADAHFSMWLLVGMFIRMALRMGYHRDPSHFPNITPFEAEMRRRIWLSVVGVDLISSAQVGLPRMIQPSIYDTKEPRNVYEDDLHENMTELPSSRPPTELTALLYLIIMTRIRTAHGKVLDLNATSQPPYRQVVNIDDELQRGYDDIPGPFKATLADYLELADSPSSIWRINLSLYFLKTEISLHRPYLLPGRVDAKYEHSRRICLNAAFQMLQFQQKLDGGRTHETNLPSHALLVLTRSWFLSSYSSQDFLLATTVLILDLDEDLKNPVPLTPASVKTGHRLGYTPPSQQQIIALLRGVQGIWNDASRQSHEAQKAAKAIKLVLAKVDTGIQDGDIGCSSYTATDQTNYVSPSSSFDFNDFTKGSDNSVFFGLGNGFYNPPLEINGMTMDIEPLNNTFNWAPLPSDPQFYQYEQHAQPPPFQ